jgi:hypothetical protein
MKGERIMKSTSKLIIFIFTFLALIASAYAQTPCEELQQMVEQLQKIPSDNALREKIIKLAIELKPAPAIPEEAREPFVMGATVLKKASDPAGASETRTASFASATSKRRVHSMHHGAHSAPYALGLNES